MIFLMHPMAFNKFSRTVSRLSQSVVTPQTAPTKAEIFLTLEREGQKLTIRHLKHKDSIFQVQSGRIVQW